MNCLSLVDSLFLYLETPADAHEHRQLDDLYAGVRRSLTFSPAFASTRPRGSTSCPRTRRRLEMTPLGLDHPVWVVDDALDLDHHVRHVALPKPGTMEQLRALVA